MKKTSVGASDLLGRVRVASPCPASWDAMEGDDRTRFCRECSLNVYDLSALTRAEAESLVARAEGRLCARFYRRADGTILTADCPVGLRAVRRRVRRTAAAVFAAVASLWTVAAGQTSSQKGAKGKEAAVACEGGGQLKIQRRPVPAGERTTFKGTVLDPVGAAVPGVRVTLHNEATTESESVIANEEGVFTLEHFAPGSYTLTVEAMGFARLKVEKLVIGVDESLTGELVITPAIDTATVGVIVLDFEPEKRNGNGKTVFDSEQILKLPRP
jgi:hypothetical protein